MTMESTIRSDLLSVYQLEKQNVTLVDPLVMHAVMTGRMAYSS